MRTLKPKYCVLGFTEIVAKTALFDMIDWRNNLRIWKLSPCIITFMRMLLLKPTLTCNLIVMSLGD